MMATDRYYTPPDIVRQMVQCVQDHRFAVIADFAAGDGQLLRAAQVQWPESVLLATDIHSASVRLLRSSNRSWKVSQCDFLAQQSRDRCAVVRLYAGKVSLVLLNPPFSGRGNSRWRAAFNGTTIRCSQALAFVLISMSVLTPDGHIVAVLPAGCLTSEKDRAAWALVEEYFAVCVVRENHFKSFPGCTARTVVVHLSIKRGLSRRKKKRPDEDLITPNDDGVRVEVFRGKLPVHQAQAASGSGWPFIHSTEVKTAGINLKCRRINTGPHLLKGPAVLIPRVGEPSPAKIGLYLGGRSIVLSDCVIALRCETAQDAIRTREALQDNWAGFSATYKGTCARYITIAGIVELLQTFGFRAHLPEKGLLSYCNGDASGKQNEGSYSCVAETAGPSFAGG